MDGTYIYSSFVAVSLALLHVVIAYECSYNSFITLRPDHGESGTLQSAGYPDSYPMVGSCGVSIEACYGCEIQLRFSEALLYPCPADYVIPTANAECDPTSKCDYFLFECDGQDIQSFHGNLTSFETKSLTTITLKFCYSNGKFLPMGVRRRWSVSFMVFDLYTYRFYGSSVRNLDLPNRGTFRSDNFPDFYEQNFQSIFYFIQSYSSYDRIFLVFDDFDIDSKYSILKIYDGPMTKSRSVTYGNNQHRPVFKSTSQYLLVLFATGATFGGHRGFKATFQFLTSKALQVLPSIIQDCEYINDRIGGAVKQRSPWHRQRRFRLPSAIDCVWILPPKRRLSVAVNILAFNVTQDSSFHTLAIYGGLHSDAPLLASVSSQKEALALKETDLQSSVGLYIRLRAQIEEQEVVWFAYTPFVLVASQDILIPECKFPRSASWLNPGFTCLSSRRCIPAHLECDGSDHCLHMEDETPERCQIEMPPTTTVSSSCHPPRVKCPGGDCVSHVGFCTEYVGKYPPQNCVHPYIYACAVGTLCYSEEQMCDGTQHCPDGKDELGCVSSLGRSLGNTWFFFLPVVLLVMALVTGCVVYKTRKSRRELCARCPAPEDVPMQTLPVHSVLEAPPSYEECMLNTDGESEPLLGMTSGAASDNLAASTL